MIMKEIKMWDRPDKDLSIIEVQRLSDEDFLERYAAADPAMQDKSFILEIFRRFMKLRDEVDRLNKFSREHED